MQLQGRIQFPELIPQLHYRRRALNAHMNLVRWNAREIVEMQGEGRHLLQASLQPAYHSGYLGSSGHQPAHFNLANRKWCVPAGWGVAQYLLQRQSDTIARLYYQPVLNQRLPAGEPVIVACC